MKFILLMAALLVAIPSMAQGDAGAKVEELLGWAQKAEADLDYDRAAEFYSSVIAHPDASEAQKVSASLHAGMIERVRGNRAEARDHFEYVLRRDINHQLPENTEPKIANYFELVRGELKKESAPPGAVAKPTDQSGSSADTPEAHAVETTEKSGDGDWVYYAIGGTAATLGVISLGTAGYLSYLMSDLRTQAEATDVQVDRVALYDDHDALVPLSNIALGVGIGLVVIGAGVASVPMAAGE